MSQRGKNPSEIRKNSTSKDSLLISHVEVKALNCVSSAACVSVHAQVHSVPQFRGGGMYIYVYIYMKYIYIVYMHIPIHHMHHIYHIYDSVYKAEARS